MDFAISISKTVAHLISNQIDVVIKRSEMSCAVDMSRNRLVADFLVTDCTHILFIDDDMGFNHEAAFNMLEKDKFFVSGAGPKKQNDLSFACTYHSDADGFPEVTDGLFRGEYVGGAFCLINRVVYERILNRGYDLKCEAIHPEFGYRFYEFKYTRHTWKTEDYSFCDLWRECGGEIWIYPDIDFIHTGVKNFHGNLHKSLLANTEKIPDNIKRMLCESYVDRVSA